MKGLAATLAVIAGLLFAAPADAVRLKPVKGVPTADIGIADQKADIFADTRFAKLGIRHVRRAVAWDALDHEWTRIELDEWMAAARVAGVQPLIAFARSRVAERRHRLPALVEFVDRFRKFRARYPFAVSFATWNEANHGGEPTFRKPHAAAAFYRAIRRECPSCRVLAADLLDQPNMVRWARAFTKAAKVEPSHWGLHNYISANRMDLRRTRDLLQAVRGKVWLTEVGGLVARRNASKTKLPQGDRHAVKVTRFILDRLVRLDARISRVYLYHWSSGSLTDTWDSAFVGPDGRLRPAYDVLRNRLARVARAKARRR